MAEFCYHCVRDLDVPALDNDLSYPMPEWMFWRWALCEGCGDHRFDRFGRRICGWVVDPAPVSGPCPSCAASGPGLAEHYPSYIEDRDAEGNRTFTTPGDVCMGCSDPEEGRWVSVNLCPVAWRFFLEDEARRRMYTWSAVEPF